MFRNILTVAWRDFLAVVRTKGFIIGLLFMPGVITLSSTVLPKLFERMADRGERRFAIADFTGELAAPMAAELQKHNERPGQKLTIALEPFPVAAAADFERERGRVIEELDGRVRGEELFGYVVIGPDALQVSSARDDGAASSPRASVTYRALSLTIGDLKDSITRGLMKCVRRLRFAAFARPDVDPTTIDRIDREPDVDEFIVSRKPGEPSNVASNEVAEHVVPLVTVVLMLMGIMQSAGLLLTSTIEEKSNRVVEVLVSSVSSFDLLAGKVLGAWMTGLVMLLAWGGAGASAANHFDWLRPGMLGGPNLAWFIYFFLTGYLLFASLYASIGAMCSSIQDAQSMMFPVVILIMIPMMSMTFVTQHPDSTFSLALTFFPFTAPFIAVMRLALSPPAPQWQIAVAAASVALSAWFLLWLGGKVFRTAILMTGKPPKPSEVWRMLREA